MKIRLCFNLLWPSDAMWQHRSGSTLAQVMTCCLIVPSHLPEPVLTNHLWGLVVNWMHIQAIYPYFFPIRPCNEGNAAASTPADVVDKNDDCTTPTSTEDTALSSTRQHGTLPAPTTPGLPPPSSGFKLKWLDERSWLRYDSQQDLMWCDICHRHQTKIRSLQQRCGPKFCETMRKRGNFIDGCTNWRTSTLNDHEGSIGHRHAEDLDKHPQIAINQRKEDQPRRKAITLALKVVHWLATEEIANMKYASLVGLLQNMKMPEALYLKQSVTVKYTSPEIFGHLLTALDQTLVRELMSDLRRSPVVGIGIDESTDRSDVKRCVWVIRYVSLGAKGADVRTAFLACRPVDDGTAATLLQSTMAVLRDYGVRQTKVSGQNFALRTILMFIYTKFISRWLDAKEM